VKFIIKSESIITVNKQDISLIATQIGSLTDPNPPFIDGDVETFDGDVQTFDGETQKF
jgi:hypothetical protein